MSPHVCSKFISALWLPSFIQPTFNIQYDGDNDDDGGGGGDDDDKLIMMMIMMMMMTMTMIMISNRVLIKVIRELKQQRRRLRKRHLKSEFALPQT